MTGVTPANPAPRGRRLWRVAVALALLGAILAWVQPDRVLSILARADPGWVLAGLLSSTLGNLASAWRWRDLAAWLGHPAPLSWIVSVYFRGVAANVVLPGAVVGGDMLRAWGLHRRGMPVLEASVSVVLDRVSGLWGLLILGALALGAGLWWAPATGWLPAVQRLGVGSAEGLALLAVGAAAGMAVLPYAALRVTPRWLAGWALLQRPALRWWHRLATHQPGQHCARQIAGSLVVQTASVTALYCGARAIGAPLPWEALAVAAVPIFVLATVPVGFGGWGTREAAAIAALTPLGYDASSAVAVSVLYGLYPLAHSALALWPVPQVDRAPPQRGD